MIECKLLPPEAWASIAKEALPLYEQAIAPSADDWSVQDAVLSYLTSQHILYAVFDDGKLVSIAQGQFVHYPKRTVFLVVLMAGRLLRCPVAVETLWTLVRGAGVTTVEAWVRPSMQRLLRRVGFEQRHIVVRKSLEEDDE